MQPKNTSRRGSDQQRRSLRHAADKVTPHDSYLWRFCGTNAGKSRFGDTKQEDEMSRDWVEAASVILAIATCYMLIVPV
jgi:hypothetical protein